MPRWRLLIDPAQSGAWNMAVDEAILDRYAAATVPPAPTLRLYGWKPAALSLGKSQLASGSCDLVFLRREGIDLVRRPTGGQAVLHEYERTYSVIGSLNDPLFAGGVQRTYRRVSGWVREGLRALGVEAASGSGIATQTPERGASPVCFEATGAHEIAVGGRKLVGAAQLRRRGAFLQHGSIMLSADPVRLSAAIGWESGASGMTDLRGLLGRTPSAREVDTVVVAAFERGLGFMLNREQLQDRERAQATWLRSWKYLSSAWTLEGRPGAREWRWGRREIRN